MAQAGSHFFDAAELVYKIVHGHAADCGGKKICCQTKNVIDADKSCLVVSQSAAQRDGQTLGGETEMIYPTQARAQAVADMLNQRQGYPISRAVLTIDGWTVIASWRA